MANPHSTDLYAIGKGVLQIALFSAGAPGTYQDVGNCPKFEIEPAIELVFERRTKTRSSRLTIRWPLTWMKLQPVISQGS